VSTLAERYKIILELTGMGPHELSKKAGLSGANIGNAIRRNADRTDIRTIRAIARAAGVSESWLATGEGEPVLTLTPTDPPTPSEVRVRVERDEPVPECLGDFKGYEAQEKRARKALGGEVDEWVWPHIRNTNMLSTANRPPPVAMLMALARALHEFGDPSAPVPDPHRRTVGVKPGGGSVGEE
jgi:hypothetical protein